MNEVRTSRGHRGPAAGDRKGGIRLTEKQYREHIKHKLSRYNSLTHERMQMEEQLAKLEATMTSPKVQNLDGMPKGSAGGNAMDNLVAELVNLQEKYKAKLLAITMAQNEVENMIESLEPTERRLMRCRYLEGMVWEEVCVTIGYSWRQTHNIHSRILDKLVALETIGE